MSTGARLAVAVVAVALLAVGVWQLRSTTMSTHVAVPDDSRLAVTVVATANLGESGQGIEEMTTAKVLMCRLEVRHSDPVGDLQRVSGEPDRFRFVLQPTLDDTDRTQFRGCLEDWNVDHLLLDVVEMHDVGG